MILKVLTGGSRFYPALFTSKVKSRQYDTQRQIIADYFATKYTSVEFIDYNTSNEDIDDEISKFCQFIEQTEIDKIFQTILMNIDWYSILSEPKNAPHGIKIPNVVAEYIKVDGDIDMLIRMGIVSIINKDTHLYWIDNIGDIKLFNETFDFFYNVSIESAKKYLAIHLMDADIDTTTQSKSYKNAIRLTVHEKKDKKDIPAILTLGRGGGDKLSQHVCSFVSQEGILFDTLFDILVKCKNSNSEIKRIMPPKEGLFDWLADGKQPLFYSNMSKEKYLEILFKIDFLTMIDKGVSNE